ncbi:MAG TPA: nucleoside triphosphate pyrophosphatase [Steroidobacteraceae bacterium]|jgi:septum formation protein|nr:nucleoside triphosphate pyrophosphatase [Steroidobacteraceae bacterium]
MSPKAVLRPLILASTSRYRAALLARFGLAFNTANPDLDEAEQSGESPRDRACRLSEAKAEAMAAQYPDAVIIGGDQVAALGSRVLRKPGNANTCREQLRLLSGNAAEFHTACTVRCMSAALKLTHVDTTTVSFRTLVDLEIDRYIEREQPFDCAGGFKAEALGISLFERMDSQDPTAIVGLPLIWLAGALRTAGFSIP